MGTPKLSSRQLAQLAFLQTLPPKFQRLHALVEQMAALHADDTVVRGLIRGLDELKANAAALSLTSLADSAGLMATIARRGGGLQMKVRGLRELLGSLKTNYEGALRQATTPEAIDERRGGPPGPSAGASAPGPPRDPR
ncbi:MAG: hypothetical protein ACREOF_03165 [Gemmatimonadales bacterium]